MDKKKKPIKFKVVKPKPKPTPQMEEKKKKIKFKVVKIADRKLDELKKKAEEQTKKDGIKRRVLPTGEVQRKKTKPAPEQKPKPVSELQRVAGVSKEQANKMDTAELFGKLPVELRKMVLDPKETGVVVGRERITYNQFIDEFEDIRDEASILEDAHLKDPNIPDSFVKKVQDLFAEVNKFRYSLRALFLDANGLKSSSKNTRQLYELLKRNNKWNKIIPYIGKSARDIWRENTGELMLKIKKLKNERKKY